MAFRRGATPLTGALPSLEASNQAQIDDLVQRNRTLEHTNKKLAEEVALEQKRGKDAVLEIQRKWESNEQQWKEGCEDILRSYRIVQKQLEIEVEMERGNVIKEIAITREEKLQRLKRDYKIKQFQMREQELELMIEDLEGEKAAIVLTMEDELEVAREKNTRYAAKLKEAKQSYQSKLEDARSSFRDATKEKEDKEAEFNELRKEHSSLEAEHKLMETNLQRTRLQLDHAQTKITELERLNNDLKRANADLTNQIERWQNLETKGGEAAEQQQKRVRELELQLQELQEAQEEEREQAAKDLAKEKKRVDNLKSSLTNWELEAKEKKKENAELEKKVAKLEKTCTKLKADLEVERARVRPPSPQKARAPSPPPDEGDEDDEIEEEEDTEEPPPPKKPPSIKKPSVSKSGSSTKAENSKAPSKPLRQIARKSTGSKPPLPYTKRPSTPEVVEISDHEEPAPKSKRKGKSKASEPEEEPEPEPEPERKQKGKRKAVDDDEEVEDAEIVAGPTVNKKASKPTNEVKETAGGGKTKVKRGGSKRPTARPGLDDQDGEDEAADAVKKKIRKIIPSFASGPFAFGNLKLAQFDDTLNIPSMLSPLKVDDHVPQRSTSSNLSGLSKLRRQ